MSFCRGFAGVCLMTITLCSIRFVGDNYICKFEIEIGSMDVTEGIYIIR